MTEKLLTADEIKDWFGGSRNAVYEAAKKGLIPHVRIGRKIRFVQSALDRHIQEQMARSTKAQTQDQSLTAAV